MNLFAQLPEIPHFKPLLGGLEYVFVLKWKHLASKDYTSNNFQDFMGTVQYEYPYSVKKPHEPPDTLKSICITEQVKIS